MESVTFHLEDFDGPLDLLLHLVSVNKMDLYHVEIVSLIDQYVALVQGSGPLTMDGTSEFIEMAARLVHMKSLLLLPRSEEADRMREELTGQLVEYSLCKQVAGKLGEMAANVYTAVRAPAAIEMDETYRLTHEARVLEEAYNALQGRSLRKQPPQQERFEPLVHAPFVTVTSRVIHVLRGLMSGQVKRLHDLFDRGAGRSQTVATFLAVLELMRGGRMQIDDDENLQICQRTHHRA